MNLPAADVAMDSLDALRRRGEVKAARHGYWRWWWRCETAPLLEALLDDPMVLFDARHAERVVVLKNDVATRLAVLDGQLVVKSYEPAKWYAPLKAIFMGSRARRAFLRGLHLEKLDIPTARVEAFAEYRRGGLVLRSCVVNRFVVGSLPLVRLLSEGRSPRCDRCIEQAAEMVASLHRHGLSNRDLKAWNLLVEPISGGDAMVRLIDLDGIRRPLLLTALRRRKDLARLERSFRECTKLEGSAWERFMTCYDRAVQA